MDFSVHFFEVLNIINGVFVAVLTITYFDRPLSMLLSFFVRRKKYPETDKLHKYGYFIAARNEECVIADLIHSIRAQDYPQDLIHIFVVADNCSDRTAEVAADAGAIVFDRHEDPRGRKSYAVDYGIKRLLAEYPDLGLDALITFDADGLLDPNYTKEINKAYAAGHKVIASYRSPKNLEDSCWAAASAYMFLHEARQVHHTRSFLGWGTYVSGTGFLLDMSYVRQFGGWPFHALDEDIDISAYMATIDEKVAFCGDARFFDEQPVLFRDFRKQRLRWARGNNEVFVSKGWKLFLSLLRKPRFTKWTMMAHITPIPALSFLWCILYVLIGLVWYAFNPSTPFDTVWAELLVPSLSNFMFIVIFGLLLGYAVMLETYRSEKGTFWQKFVGASLFPFGMVLMCPYGLYTFFADVVWEPIRRAKQIKNSADNQK